jgi:hypothetical protein
LNIVGELSKYYGEKPVIRSLLHLIPGWSSADTLLQQRANEIRSERMRAFFDELAAGKHVLTDELIATNDFLHCYFSTLRAALNTRQIEKIKILARLLDSSLAPSIDTSTDEYEELLSALDSISLREFKVLCILFKIEQNNPLQDGYEIRAESGSQEEYVHIKKYWAAFKSEAVTSINIPEASFRDFMFKMERTGLYCRIIGGPVTYTGYLGRTTSLFRRLLQFVEL